MLGGHSRRVPAAQEGCAVTGLPRPGGICWLVRGWRARTRTPDDMGPPRPYRCGWAQACAENYCGKKHDRVRAGWRTPGDLNSGSLVKKIGWEKWAHRSLVK